ncbi:MAG: RnfABCDGE type electron transport complex subunit D [Lachnospiraceae bacterium]
MDGKLIVSSSPHISSPVKTKNIMLDVIIALIPSLIASIYFFGTESCCCCYCFSSNLCNR